MNTKITAKCIVFNGDGNVLLLRRSGTDEARAGEWDFPGGGVELHEDVLAAVSREIAEETNLEVNSRDIYLTYTDTRLQYDLNNIRLVYYCRIQAQEIRLSFEHSEYIWVTPAEALQKFPHPVYGEGLRRGLTLGLFNSAVS